MDDAQPALSSCQHHQWRCPCGDCISFGTVLTRFAGRLPSPQATACLFFLYSDRIPHLQTAVLLIHSIASHQTVGCLLRATCMCREPAFKSWCISDEQVLFLWLMKFHAPSQGCTVHLSACLLAAAMARAMSPSCNKQCARGHLQHCEAWLLTWAA